MQLVTSAHTLRAVVVGLALLSPLGSAPAFASPPSAEHNPIATANQLGVAFSRVAEQASPSVVSIQVEIKRAQPNFGFFFPFGGGMPGDGGGGVQKGGGSGMVLTADGAILTNNHVVDGATRIEVAFQDGRRMPAKVVGVDPATDLAVLKVDAKGLPAVKFADSDAARVGEWVIAIGSPFGLDYSITAGVLSAKGRGGMGANEIEDYLQTDASINPGNSGGPLIDLDGQVLGINTMIIGHASGIGFAIPSNLARKVAMDLLQKGDVSRAWIGVSYQELTPELASSFGVQRTRGALVNEVMANGPAAKAGIRAGDIITDIQGREVREGRDLLRAVLQYPVGEKLAVTVLRDGGTQKITVTTAARPDQREARAGGAAKPGKQGQAKPQHSRGLDITELTPEIARRIGYQGQGGVVVANVIPGSAADRAGLMRGDVIEEVNKKAVGSPQKLEELLGGAKVLLKVHRQGGTFFAALSSGD
jgi:Do/DeqQ family serine protease